MFESLVAYLVVLTSVLFVSAGERTSAGGADPGLDGGLHCGLSAVLKQDKSAEANFS
jgi:hypothetical protein